MRTSRRDGRQDQADGGGAARGRSIWPAPYKRRTLSVVVAVVASTRESSRRPQFKGQPLMLILILMQIQFWIIISIAGLVLWMLAAIALRTWDYMATEEASFCVALRLVPVCVCFVLLVYSYVMVGVWSCVCSFVVVEGHWKTVDWHVAYVARVVAIHEGQTAERSSPSM